MFASRIAVQSHSVKNTRHLIVALIQHTFTQLLPMPHPEEHAGLETIQEAPDDKEGDEAEVTPPKADAQSTGPSPACVWREPMCYADQLDLLVLLQRLIEHFAAAALSIDHTRSLDGVRMVVPACIAAVADVLMRRTPRRRLQPSTSQGSGLTDARSARLPA